METKEKYIFIQDLQMKLFVALAEKGFEMPDISKMTKSMKKYIDELMKNEEPSTVLMWNLEILKKDLKNKFGVDYDVFSFGLDKIAKNEKCQHDECPTNGECQNVGNNGIYCKRCDGKWK